MNYKQLAENERYQIYAMNKVLFVEECEYIGRSE